jgi:hypothetical protein
MDRNIEHSRDLLGSVAELARRAGALQQALGQAVVRGRVVREGTDDSGTITIVLDDEGTASDVRVAEDWREFLADPQEVAAAVLAADSDAATRRATATAEAIASADLDESAVDSRDPARGWMVPVPLADNPSGQRRTLSELTAAVLTAANDFDRVRVPPPPTQGVSAGGSVRITLEHGRITQCRISERWLGHQDDVSLAQALREAVSAAATAGLNVRRPFIEHQQRLDALLAEARTRLTEMGSRS